MRLMESINRLVLVSILCAGCSREPEHSFEARLFKRAKPPIELVSGDTIAVGEELYLSVSTSRPLYFYVVSEDAVGERWVIYPCRTWSENRLLRTGRLYRLPLPVLGRPSFWQVRSATQRERILVLASERPVIALDAAVSASPISEPCTAILGSGAQGWVNRVMSVADTRRRTMRTEQEGQIWISLYDLAGAAYHGTG